MPLTSDLRSTRQTTQSDFGHAPTEPAKQNVAQQTKVSVDQLEVSPGAKAPTSPLLQWNNLVDLSQIDLNTIQKGMLRVSVPLKKGIYQLPGFHSNAKVKVKKEATALLSLAISRNEKNEPIVLGANLEINPPLKIKNPASAYQSEGRFSNWFRDSMADLVMRGLSLTQEGKVVVDGFVSKGILGTEKLDKHFDPNRFPKIDMKLESLLGLKPKLAERPKTASQMKKAMAKPAASAASSSLSMFNGNWTIHDILQKVGAMTDRAKYSLQLSTDAVSIGVGPKDFRAWTEKSPVKVELRGQAKVTEQGSVEVANDQRASTISNKGGKLNVGGQILVSDVATENQSVEAHIGMNANVKQVRGVMRPDEHTDVPFAVGGKGNFVSAQTFARIDKTGKVSVQEASSLSVNLDTQIDSEIPVRVEPLSMKLGKGAVHTRAGLSFGMTDQVHVHDGEAQVDIVGSNVDVDVSGFKGNLSGELGTTMKAHRLQYHPSNKFPSAQGETRYYLKPSDKTLQELPELKPFERILDFQFNHDGTLALNPKTTGLTEFVSPYADFVWAPEGVCDPKAAPAGPIGSKAWRQKIEEVTRTPIRPNNRVELLVDGVQSYPKRMELIKNAKHSICVQTLIFKDDKTGMETAQALIEAKKRGVEVYVIVDSLGNIESVRDVVEGNKIYKVLQDGGVHFKLYSNVEAQGVKEIMEVVGKNDKLQIQGLRQLIDPAHSLQAMHILTNAAQGSVDLGLSDDDRKKLLGGLAKVWGGKRGMSPEEAVGHLASLTADNVLELKEVVQIAKQMIDLQHRWHEKYLIVDGEKAIVGGLNIADEYLLGGTGEKASSMGKTRTAWRDTDMLIEGPAARDAYDRFSNNWETVAGERLKSLEGTTTSTPSDESTSEVQMVQSRPRNDGDHHITNFMIESLKALEPGEKAYAAIAYFLPTGALKAYEQALCDAAQRGVDVRIVTNGKESTDLPQLNQAAMASSYRTLLKAGVRIFERTGDRTMHTKASVFGSQISAVGSWNADNRSASLNSECLAITHDAAFAKKVEDMVLADMGQDVAVELKLSEVAFAPAMQEIENSTVAMLNDLM